MLQLDPEKRADINQVLSDPIFDKFKKLPFYSPLSGNEYTYLLDSYLLNTKGVVHLHLPDELSKLRIIKKELSTSREIGIEKKTITEDYLTYCSSTMKSDSFPFNFPEIDGLSQHESLNDFLMGSHNEEMTVMGFPTFDEHYSMCKEVKDSLSQPTFMESFPDHSFWKDELVDPYYYELSSVYPNDHFSYDTKMNIENNESSSPKNTHELNPRIISIKRKQSIGKDVDFLEEF